MRNVFWRNIPRFGGQLGIFLTRLNCTNFVDKILMMRLFTSFSINSTILLRQIITRFLTIWLLILFRWFLEIWQALRRAAESDLPYAQAIIDENRIRLVNRDMSVCYDELNIRYELPLYVLSEPENLLDRPRQDPVRRPSMMDRLRRNS